MIGCLAWLAIALLYGAWDLIGDTTWHYDCSGGSPPDVGSASGCQTVIFPDLTYGETYFLGLEVFDWILGIVPLATGLIAVGLAVITRERIVLIVGLCVYVALVLMAVVYTQLSPGATWEAEPVWIGVLAVIGAGVGVQIIRSLTSGRGLPPGPSVASGRSPDS